ncbi:Lar family restriction alleviation protein [Comamonas koreensis]|uniref:Lar family restriction alleviation protein n=1 Tax=Comamonas koreensis TaxID=160825 RepID=UPI0015F8E919|nr:Lar family restriction alleviation protein [Comamonas koreensis]
MTDKTEAQPEALYVAEQLDATRHAFGDDNAQSKRRASAELRRQHAEIQQLKAQLSARQAAPDGWVPCTITYEGQHPEDVAYGPKIMMARLKKWLVRYFALKAEVHSETKAMPLDEHGIAPCPLCGSKSKHVKSGESDGHRILCWSDECECSSGYFFDKEAAISSWNSRTKEGK